MPTTAKKSVARIARPQASKKPITTFTKKDAMVDDPTTGLTWCADPINVSSWADAEEKAKACRVGGHTDWRMPTVKELITIVDYGKRDPAIDTRLFKMPKSGEWLRFWSSSPVVGWPEYAWGVYFSLGYVNGDDVRYYGGFVRPVRAARARQYSAFGLNLSEHAHER